MTTSEHTNDVNPLARFPVQITLPVAWGEMDVFGHVNNTVYFRYCESARIAYLERIGLTGAREGDQVGPIVASTACRFRRALIYPDTVRVGARTVELREDRFTMHYRIVSVDHGMVAADAEAVVVGFDYGARRKAPLPADVAEAIRALEGGRV